MRGREAAEPPLVTRILESLCKPPDEILNLIYLYIHWPIHKDLSHLGHLPLGPILGGLGSGSWANGCGEK